MDVADDRQPQSRRTIVGPMARPSGRRRARGLGSRRSAMVLVAEGAVFLLRPGDRPIEPAPVSESRLFTAAQIERGRIVQRRPAVALRRRPRRRGVVLVALALAGRRVRAPRATRGTPGPRRGRDRRRPLGGPRRRRPAGRDGSTRARGRLRDLDPGVGIVARATPASRPRSALSWPPRARRCCWRCCAASRGGGGSPGRSPWRRSPSSSSGWRRWCSPRSTTGSRRSRPPARPAPRSEPGERARGRRGQVYRVDASRRVRSLNAYVDGIGSTRRVVLYDNLLRRANRPELRSVVAHELGHVKHDDVLAGPRLPDHRHPARAAVRGAARRRARAAVRSRPAQPGGAPGLFAGLAVAALVARASPATSSRARSRRAPTPSPFN